MHTKTHVGAERKNLPNRQRVYIRIRCNLFGNMHAMRLCETESAGWFGLCASKRAPVYVWGGAPQEHLSSKRQMHYNMTQQVANIATVPVHTIPAVQAHHVQDRYVARLHATHLQPKSPKRSPTPRAKRADDANNSTDQLFPYLIQVQHRSLWPCTTYQYGDEQQGTHMDK